MKDGQWQFLVRPYAEDFIKEMSIYYEIVIFTAATKEYADWILDLMDNKKVISYRLYRQHTVAHNNCFLKVKKKKNPNLNLNLKRICQN